MRALPNPSLFLVFVLFLPLVAAQQYYGSFFAPIFLNGAPISSSQVSCSGMGQPSYCCASGHSCAWDNQGQLACCPQGTTCTGNLGAVAAGQYTQHVQQTQPVQQNGCNCEQTSIIVTPTTNVLPVVPVATVTTPIYPINPQTVTTTVAGAAPVASNACPTGYSTVTQANVGQPTRTVGCYVIIDSGAKQSRSFQTGTLLLLIILWVLWVS